MCLTSHLTSLSTSKSNTAPLTQTQALRNLALDGDPAVLRREVARLAAEVEALRGGRNAAALALVADELAASNEAGARLAADLQVPAFFPSRRPEDA